MDTTKELTHVSLCAGYAGIDLGLKRAIPSLRTVAFSEIEAYPCANLVAKMEEGLLDAAPIWTDIKTFPWSAFRGRVDVLSGGYPCQPFSAVGKRLGTQDPRHLWPFIADGIRLMRPRVCLFENVEGHISLGLREVLSELGEMGYRATWGIFSASECGAPHERKVFILAVLDDASFTRLERHIRPDGDEGGWEDEDRPTPEAVVPAWRRVVFADECEQCECCDDVICPNCGTHYADCGCPGPTQDGIEHLEVGGVEFGRSDTNWPQYPAHGVKDCEPPRLLLATGQSDLGGNPDGLADRVDRLRLCGNGVVPATAERAFRVLWRELVLGEDLL